MRRTKIKKFAMLIIVGLAWQSLPNTFGRPSGTTQPVQAAPLPGGGVNTIQSSVLIESIQVEGTNIVAKVDVSADVKTVVLESRARVNGGTWEPRSVQRLSDFTTPAKVVTFRFPRTADMEMLRARGETTDVLPPTFYKETNSTFVAINGLGSISGAPPVATAVGDNKAGAAPTESAPTTAAATSRDVVESDIWKIDGDTLYFFNQYRGLQVIDIGHPDAPAVLGTYDLPAAGEQMYLPSPNHVVLMAHDNCSGWGTTAESQLILLEINSGKPTLVAQLDLPGQIRESRLVGTAIYVVSERYAPVTIASKPGSPPQLNWEWGSQVTSFDLSNFSKPVAKSKDWIPGSGNAIMATDRFLFVAAPPVYNGAWNANSEIHVYDISAPDGTMQTLSTIQAKGRVKDKFKMNLNGDAFTAVTETWGQILTSQVETFSLADPKSPQKLGFMKIIDNEQLYATRFDGDLLYIVTFKRIDPLWIIDLSKPEEPKKVSELQIPGVSTFIQPLDGRLVTVGIDNTAGWRTAVQLFDVQNPAKPALLSKVILGEQYSQSEANFDEKAFGVLPEANLILVPYSSYGNVSSFQGVHLIDLNRDSLTKRGVIKQEMQSRRATVHRDRILSISGVDLLTVDAADRDNPKVTAQTELSWSADRIFLQGPHLIELSSQWSKPVSLKVVMADNTSEVVKQMNLSDVPFLGATVKDQRLYVLQGQSTQIIWPEVYNPTNYFPIGTNQAQLTLSVLDLSKLPDITLIGTTSTKFDNQQYWSSFDALWPKPGVVVWSAANRYGPIYFRGGPMIADAAPTAGIVSDSRIAFAPWWWGNSEAQFYAFDVTDSTKPEFASQVKVSGTNYWWNYGKAYTAEGLIFVSHQGSEFLADIKAPSTVDSGTATKPTLAPPEPPPGIWVQRYYLDVINFANPKEPSVRKPTSIPGALIGVSHRGQLLYTQGYRYGNLAKWSDYYEWLDAVTYDGVETHLVDSFQLPQTYPRPVLTKDAYIFLGRVSEIQAQVVDVNTQPSGSIETWTVDDSGKFARVGTTSVEVAAVNFQNIGDILSVQANNNDLKLFDATNPAALKLRGGGNPPGCVGYSLDYATGTLDRGLWIPLGMYGVEKIAFKP